MIKLTIKQLLILIAFLAITPLARPMQSASSAESADERVLTFDEALDLAEEPEAMVDAFIAILHDISAIERKPQAAIINSFLTKIIQTLELMKKEKKNAHNLPCVFDIDHTLMARIPELQMRIAFIPTLMLYHAAVALRYPVHIITARYAAENSAGDQVLAKTHDDLLALSMDDFDYTLYASRTINFNEIDEKAGRDERIGWWKQSIRREIAAGDKKILFTIDDLQECLEGEPQCLGTALCVPSIAFMMMYAMAQKNPCSKHKLRSSQAVCNIADLPILVTA